MKHKTTFWYAAILSALSLQTGCATVDAPDAREASGTDTLAVTVMTFNVQNLFDNDDDAGKDDKAYLPIEAKQGRDHIDACNEIEVASWRDECLNLDWSLVAIEHKLTVLADTIRQVEGGRGADIIALQEVENVMILERLRTGHLAELGYEPAILVEGSDLRGIDVAFLSKFPLARPPVLHPLQLAGFPHREGDTRGVLQADFLLPNGAVMTGFSVHFPAPFHPTEMRIAAYTHLTELLQALPDSQHAFAAGDFNTTSIEDNDRHLLDDYARPYWTLAHDIGCETCKGTHYYARCDNWSFLDMILFSPNRGKKTTWQIRANSVRIANRHAQQTTEDGTPLRFDPVRRLGVSDHWPLLLTLETTQKQ